MILRGRRFKRGSLELSMPELKIDLDADGRVTGAHLEKNTESHQIIEEFMLAANEAVAQRLADAGLLFLRRVHGNPDPRKQKVLTEFVRELGFEVENLENRFELQKLLEEVKGDPREHAVNYAVLRSMQRAVYSPEDEGHYALASDCYCHFTSPIRRYPDLTIHRLIDELNRGNKPVQQMDDLVGVGRPLQRARAASRRCRARAEQGQAAALPRRQDRHGARRRDHGRREFRPVRHRHRAAGRGLHSHQRSHRRLLPLRPRGPRDRGPPGAATRTGWATRSAWPWRRSTSTPASLDFRLVARITGGKRVSVHMPARARGSLKEDLRRGKKKTGDKPGKPRKGGKTKRR